MRWTVRLALITISASIPAATTYLPQPLLTLISDEFHVVDAQLGLAASAMPIGFAVGVIVLIPLSDRVQPRTLSQIQAASAAVFLLAASLAPTFLTLCLALLLAGVAAAFAQVLMPFAIRLAPEKSAGTVAAILSGSFLVAIFSTRIVGAWFGGAVGWRPVFVFAAVLMVGLIAVIRVAVPISTQLRPEFSYRAIMAALPRLAAKSPTLLGLAACQACFFFAFQGLWSIMTLHFTAAPFRWTVAQAGLVGLAGVAAGLLAFFTGRLVDRWGTYRAATASAVVCLAAMLAMVIAPSAVAVIVGLFLLCLASQASQAATQSRALRAVAPHQAGSANTIYMTCLFVGGALGAGSASWLFALGGVGAVAFSAVVPLALSVILLTFVMRRRITSTAI
jgi:predicted MFS family arabinose efflux permease